METESGLSTTLAGSSWTQVYYDAFSAGFAASIKIDSAECPTFCMVRVDRDIGTFNGNKLSAEIRIQAGEGSRNISYRLREYDTATGEMLSEISRGYIGDKNGTTWEIEK